MNIVEALHGEAKGLLEGLGFKCASHQVADIFTKSGSAIWEDGRVHIYPELVDWAVDTAPKFHQFKKHFGVPEHSWGGGGTAPYVFEHGELRQPTDQDVVEIMRILEAHNIPFTFRGVGPRHDAEVDVNQVKLMRDSFSGVIYVYVATLEGLIAVHDEFGRDNRIITSHSTFYSPLKLNTAAANVPVHIMACKLGLPVFLTVMPISYSSGPATIYGLALQAHAECLAGLVMTQLLNPGNMTVMAAFPLFGDPRMDYNISFGSIDHQSVNLLCAAVYDYLCLPCNQDGCSAGHYPNDFNYDDVYRSYRIWHGQKHWHQCRHAFGFLEGQNAFSIEQAYRDLAILERVLYYDEIEELPPWRHDQDAKDVIWEVCSGGLDDYRNHMHTIRNTRPVR